VPQLTNVCNRRTLWILSETYATIEGRRLDSLLFLVQYCVTELVQRILKCGDTHHDKQQISPTLNKSWTIWYESPATNYSSKHGPKGQPYELPRYDHSLTFDWL